MRSPFLERLDRGPILSDGAIGTQLYDRGVPYGRSFDELNLTDRSLVSSVHRDYLAAGAEVITTNTFGANRVRLAEFGLQEKVRAINLQGVKIARDAREVSGRSAFVAGSVGPILRPLREERRGPEHQLIAAFREQIEALLEGGADLISLETFSDLDEIRLAIRATRQVCELPIIAQMTFGDDGLTLGGLWPEDVVERLQAYGADLVGVNCSVGPQSVLDTVERMRSAGATRLSAQPNAGLPSKQGQHFVYITGPEYFAEYAEKFISAGVQLVGGCCGSTPAHTAAMARVLNGPAHQIHAPAHGEAPLQGRGYSPVEVRPKPPSTSATNGHGQCPPTQLAQAIERGDFIISVELDPPKGLNPTKVLDGAKMLARRGVQFVNVADSPMARVRMGALSMAKLIQDCADVETIIHFTTRDRNLMALQSELIGAHAMGVRNVLALTGDPPTLGDYPDATGVWDIDSIGLIETLSRLNSGSDRAGRSIGANASFCIGCAVDPTAEDLEAHLDRFWRKLEAGAHYVMSQPLYDIEALHEFLDRVGPLPVPFLLGVLPLQSFKHADYMHNEVPGIRVPEGIRKAMHAAGPHGIQEGIRLAQEFVDEAQDRVQGIYLMPSFGRYEQCAEVIDALDSSRRPGALAKTSSEVRA
ncbi:MAG: bifunctional homocysteine S-methyltransferase/methylenetetrahydrofolate reductase [Chloroflexota bacterium]|nr:bifunctional homocysteine S-methyltransferase/methylenetetrahydrofolate reductase [Chloroflexota bacterium]